MEEAPSKLIHSLQFPRLNGKISIRKSNKEIFSYLLERGIAVPSTGAQGQQQQQQSDDGDDDSEISDEDQVILFLLNFY